MWYAYAANRFDYWSSLLLVYFGKRENLASERASERDDFYFVFFSPFAFHFGVKKKTLPGSGKEQQQQLQVLLFVWGWCSGKAGQKSGS
jgi:hypothetical protein